MKGTGTGRGCLVMDRQGRVLLAYGCGYADTALYPRRLVRLILALRELSGGAVLTQLEVGACKVRAVACPCFTVVLVPHAGSADVSDVEALHIAHMLPMLYPAELGTQKCKGEGEACNQHPSEDEYSAQQEMRTDIDEDLDKDALSDAQFLSFQHSYLEPALSRPPASIHWLTPLAACPGVIHASIVAHVMSEQTEATAGSGTIAGVDSDLLVLCCPGLSEEAGALAQLVHSSICSQARGCKSSDAFRGTSTRPLGPRGSCGGHCEGMRLWEWIVRWSRLAVHCKEDGHETKGEATANSASATGSATRSFLLPASSAASVFGSRLSVLVSPTGRRACGTLPLSLVVILARDPSHARLASAGWGRDLKTSAVEGSMRRGQGLVLQGCGKEEGLAIASLPERMAECMSATLEALHIAFPADVPTLHAAATTDSARPAAPPDAKPASHPPTGPPAPAERGVLVPVPPKRQRNSSAGPRRPQSRGEPLSRSALAAGQTRRAGEFAPSGGTHSEKGGKWEEQDGKEGEQIDVEARSANQLQISSLSRPLTDSNAAGHARKRAAGQEDDGGPDEAFGPEVGGHASRLRSQLRSSKWDAEQSGAAASSGASGSRIGAGAGRSESLRSSKLYTDLGFATPRKQEPASDTNPYRLVDLYKGTPDKGAARVGDSVSVECGHHPDDDSGQPLSLDMLEGGARRSLPVGQEGNGAAPGGAEGVPHEAPEILPSPATRLSSTLDDMAL